MQKKQHNAAEKLDCFATIWSSAATSAQANPLAHRIVDP